MGYNLWSSLSSTKNAIVDERILTLPLYFPNSLKPLTPLGHKITHKPIEINLAPVPAQEHKA